ncbi:MAG TPA: serine/threonine-protein kinase [Gemmatimonadales bacterium]|nr:serine/threonine-protein kinase [Gemmatimonadales bacterium]
MGATVMDQVDRLRAALADRYELDREIGSGGMAHVYLAHDRQHDRDVAIKVLRPELAAAIGSERFLREIHIAAHLQHPHILPLYDSGTADGLLYYVMPYVTGETLRQRIRREKQLPLADALQITREVAEALSCAHAQGVVHRDIKPANILLSGAHALVADFGIGKVISEADEDALTATGMAIGTPEYMSPEQGSGDHGVDARSDIYSLGCVLYEMLAGEPPFNGRTAQTILARHRHDTPAPLRTVRPTVSPELEAVVATALAKVPADRFTNALRLTEALNATTGTRPVSEPGRLRRPRSLRGAAALGIAVAVVLAVWRVGPKWSGGGDPNKVMVFPVVDHRPGSQDNHAGEEIAILIGSALEHTEPLKWIDGWTLLDERQRQDARLLTARAARALSSRQQAAYYLEGSIAGIGDSVTVTLRLHDTRGDSLVGQTSVSGVVERVPLPQIGLRAVGALLPSLLQPGASVDSTALAALADRQPAAIASWLQGEREYRRSRFGAALGYFDRAVQADSALAPAALRGAEAADWARQPAKADSLVTAALAHATLLPTRYAQLAYGMKNYFAGDADSAVFHFQRALVGDTTWSEAWMRLGETYYHLVPRGWALDSSAEAAFVRAQRLDRSFTPPLLHLAEIALRKGRVNEAQRLVDGFRRAGPDSTMSRHLQLMMDCVRNGSGRVNWEAAAREDPAAALESGRVLSAAGASLDCAIGAFRAVLRSPGAESRVKWGGLLGVNHVLMAEHHYDAAKGLLDSAVAGGLPAAMGLYVLDATVGTGMEQKAAGVIASLEGTYDSMTTDRLWYHGIWQAHLGDSTKLAAVTRALRNIAARSGAKRDSVVAEMMTARLSLLRADTAAAMATLQRLTPAATPSDIGWGVWESLPSERLELGRLLLARGHNEEALRVADGFDHQASLVYLLYLPASLGLRIEAAEHMGRHELVSRLKARLATLEHAP